MSDSSPSLNRAKLADWGMTALVVGLLLWAAFAFMQPSQLEQLANAPAPAFRLKTAGGEVVGPGDYEGKVILLDFWATWCTPCFRQMPAVQQVADDHPDDLVVLAINVDDPTDDRRELMREFLEKAGIDVDPLLDDGSVSTMYGIESIPALVVIRPDGTVYWASSGVHDREVLEERIAEAQEDG